MITESFFKKRVVGAINTCIQLVNESDKWNIVGRGIIENEWQSYVIKNNNTFVAVLTILGEKKKIHFAEKEWIGFDLNIIENMKLQELLLKYNK